MKDSQSLVEDAISNLFLSASIQNHLSGDSISALDDMLLDDVKETLVKILNRYIDDNA